MVVVSLLKKIQVAAVLVTRSYCVAGLIQCSIVRPSTRIYINITGTREGIPKGNHNCCNHSVFSSGDLARSMLVDPEFQFAIVVQISVTLEDRPGSLSQ